MIYTFYSFKGGVGRSMALVNVAELFYRAGKKVLIVDWDLEAPGLERFFPNVHEEVLDKLGVIDMLLDYKEHMHERTITSGEDLPFLNPEKLAIDIYPISPVDGKLFLLTAGRRSGEHFAEYASSVLNFDWHDFYITWKGELYFEWLRYEFEKMADVVLIDSRTGVTEMGGVCTYQFADVVVMFCAPNAQNLDGTYKMALDFMRPEVQSLRKERALNLIVVPSRVEIIAEGDLLNNFYDAFVEKFSEFVPDELSKDNEEVSNLPQTSINREIAKKAAPFWKLKIPYLPYYSFRELVAVRELKPASQPIIDAYLSLSKAIQRFDQLLGNIKFDQLLGNISLDTKNRSIAIIVDINKNGDYVTIADAMKAANSGDKILIKPGLYRETLVIDKPINIIGDGNSNEIIIQGKEKSTIIFHAISGHISNLSLRQLANIEDRSCVDITKGSLELDGCDITSEGSGCVIVSGGSNPFLHNNRIHDGKQVGILVNNNSKGKFEYNEIFNNGSGIEILDNADPTLSNNRIQNNRKNGVIIYNDGKGNLENNKISNNALAGIEIKERGNPFLRRNKICDGMRGGVLIHKKGQGVLEENEIFGNSLAGVQISDNCDPALRRNQIHDNKQNGILINKGSKGMIEGNDVYSNAFHNIEIDKESNPELRSNKIHDGEINGLYIHGNSQPLIEDNDIFDNAQAGVRIGGFSNPILRRNQIHDDKGVGIYIVDYGNSIIEDNDIFGNKRAGVAIEGGEPLLHGNRINRNGTHAISIHYNGAGTIEDNDLRDNKKGPWDVSESNKLYTTSRNLE